MIVTFCGHSEVYQAELVHQWLVSEVDAAIQDGAETFLLGGYGGFDAMAARVVWEEKKKHSNIPIIKRIPQA